MDVKVVWISPPTLLKYPTDPRPCIVDWRPDELIYKSVPSPIIVEVTSANRREVDT